MIKTVLFLLLLVLSSNLYTQQSVGLFYNTPQSYDGYTLFAPAVSDTTYLINNCGEKVHSWFTNTTPGNSVYLLENGLLLRTGKALNERFGAGGNGGLVQMLDWDSNLIWEYNASDSSFCQHHDIEPLPNGNILMLLWVTHTPEEAKQAGRIIYPNELWSEKVIEVKPDLVNGGGEIVWEWDSWDHYVQDYSDEYDNYGDVSNPRKININYSTKGFNNRDWLHINSIDFNPRLNQIMLSNHNFGEILIIDHSTTTSEAKTDKGGNCGYGGDLLYRWGNPMAYGQGTEEEIKLFVQHDPHWISDSLPDGGKIMIFNNNIGSKEELDYSAIHIVKPAIDLDDKYIINDGKFGPDDPDWTYTSVPKTDFFSKNLSSAQRLPNGNTFLCEGAIGRFTEINPSNEKVWQYVNPTGLNGRLIQQGGEINSNQVFRAERISRYHPSIIDKELIPDGYIELGSDFTCDLYNNETSVNFEDNMYLTINKFDNRVELVSEEMITNIEIFNSIGAKIYATQSTLSSNSISTVNFGIGVYFLKIYLNNKVAYRKILID